MDDMKQIDWNGKLEAVNRETGEVVPVTLTKTDANDHYMSRRIGGEIDGGMTCWFRENGKHSDPVVKWTIRNVATPAEEWGPEIKVDGKRPEWLGDDERWQWMQDGQWHTAEYPLSHYNWRGGDSGAIRLPANHPHYRTHKPATPPSSLSTGVDRLERMEALVRRLARGFHMTHVNDDGIGEAEAVIEAQQIVALLPEPPDPDLVKAREIVATILDDLAHPDTAAMVRNGHADKDNHVKRTLAALKAGREMGR